MAILGQVKIKLSKEECEADGSNCLRCNEPIYLKAYRIKIHENSLEFLCQSCGETMEDTELTFNITA